MKWLDMFNNWDKWVSRRFQKVSSPLVFGVWACTLMTRLGVIDQWFSTLVLKYPLSCMF